MSVRFLTIMTWLSAMLTCSCSRPLQFPASTTPNGADGTGAKAAWDTNADGRADFFAFSDPAGRFNRIGYAHGDDGRGIDIVDIDKIPAASCRHLIIILDGFGYEVLKRYYDGGGLRMFHQPSRVIVPYPTLTDLCIEDELGYIPCLAFEARYYNRRANHVVGGSMDYLAGKNEPYNRLLDYRATPIWDAIGYLKPWSVFRKELRDCAKLYDRGDRREIVAYFVSSAGISTQDGAAGQTRALVEVERLVNQVIWRNRGLTKVTMLSDHGHSYTPSRQIPIDRFLRKRGWRLTNRLTGQRDVAYIRFGLETYASFATKSPADLAADLASCEGVTIASYAQGDAVAVLGQERSKAIVRRKVNRYSYETQSGDPLQLKTALASLQADTEGYYGADDLLKATIDGQYPDPLARLWRAHFALAENVPDVIVSLEDRYYSGSASFGGAVTVASTHGSLNKRNSTAFIISTIAPLPPFMRAADVPLEMKKLAGGSFAHSASPDR